MKTETLPTAEELRSNTFTLFEAMDEKERKDPKYRMALSEEMFPRKSGKDRGTINGWCVETPQGHFILQRARQFYWMKDQEEGKESRQGNLIDRLAEDLGEMTVITLRRKLMGYVSITTADVQRIGKVLNDKELVQNFWKIPVSDTAKIESYELHLKDGSVIKSTPEKEKVLSQLKSCK